MTVFDYVAKSNPLSAKRIIESFGYRVTNPHTMGKNLATVVNDQGQSALRAVMDNHPDKEIILELYGKPTQSTTPCGCKDKEYRNASGPTKSTDPSVINSQTNIIILASAVILAVAVISRNK